MKAKAWPQKTPQEPRISTPVGEVWLAGLGVRKQGRIRAGLRRGAKPVRGDERSAGANRVLGRLNGEREIAESAISGRKTGAPKMARLYNVSAPAVSRIVAAHRTGLA
jgi:hypothetical protein